MLTLRLCVLAVALSALVSCSSGDSPSLSNPAAPTSVNGTLPSPSGWLGDATVLSASNSGGCGWGRMPGETRSGVLWSIVINGTSVTMNEDMVNWPTDHIPYTGSLSGQQFTASHNQGDDYLRWVCQFKNGELTGSFSPDFSTFDAQETLVWGTGATETRVLRRWHAAKQ
jgi:hypothetical protein